MAELDEPQAGNTVSNRCRDSSRYTLTPAFTPNGHTPPTAWPISGSTSSKASILALQPKRALYLGLSTLASPAATIRITPSFVRKDSVLAMRAGSQPTASAASSTVADDTSNSSTRLSASNCFRYCFAFSMDMVYFPPLCSGIASIRLSHSRRI